MYIGAGREAQQGNMLTRPSHPLGPTLDFLEAEQVTGSAQLGVYCACRELRARILALSQVRKSVPHHALSRLHIDDLHEPGFGRDSTPREPVSTSWHHLQDAVNFLYDTAESVSICLSPALSAAAGAMLEVCLCASTLQSRRRTCRLS